VNAKTGGTGAELPVYGCPRIAEELELTGRLDDPLWQKAPAANLVETVSGKPGKFATEVRALCSATTFYVGFHCEDDYVWGTMTEYGSDIFKEEVVEIFVSPTGGLQQYFEINLSPKNVLFDACIFNSRTGPGPRSSANLKILRDFSITGIRTAVHVEGELDKPGAARFWRAEYAIPLDQLFNAPHNPPEVGDRWRINFYRIDSPRSGEQELYAWSPTGFPDFHAPWRFGTLTFQAPE